MLMKLTAVTCRVQHRRSQRKSSLDLPSVGLGEPPLLHRPIDRSRDLADVILIAAVRTIESSPIKGDRVPLRRAQARARTAWRITRCRDLHVEGPHSAHPGTIRIRDQTGLRRI